MLFNMKIIINKVYTQNNWTKCYFTCQIDYDHKQIRQNTKYKQFEIRRSPVSRSPGFTPL